MKVILSRKGFDSQYGRIPSPVLPDGRMVSLPIPDKDSPTPYEAIRRDELAFADLVVDLGAKRGRPARQLAPTDLAHLDPDLDQEAVPRPDGWRPIFGQSGSSLGHLRNEGVDVGDLFLFFGWFRPVERLEGRWQYISGSRSFHALWGWLLIGGFHRVDASLPAAIRRWAARHPHLRGSRPVNNSVIVAADDFVLADYLHTGAGIFPFAHHRVLTEPGSERRGVWRLPSWMQPKAGQATLSYHKDPGRWAEIDDLGCRLRVVDRGQEFVLETHRTDLLDQWLGEVFSGAAPA